MPVHFLADVISCRVASEHYATLAACLIATCFLKTWSQGPSLLDLSTDLMDLHHHVILVATGAFTPLGLVVLSSLAHRGAHIVALTPTLSSSHIHQLISLLRSSTNNELIYAEACDTSSLSSINAFAAQWNSGESGIRRLDTLLFLQDETEDNLGRFHLLNALLPSLLLLPPERDVRIVSCLSPWYAAGLHAKGSRWTKDGSNALEWYILTREWQRRLNLLAETDTRQRDRLPGIHPVSLSSRAGVKGRKSNVSLVNVCTGFERNSHVLRYLLPEGKEERLECTENQEQSEQDERRNKAVQGLGTLPIPPTLSWSITTVLRYLLMVLLWPIIWLLTKSPAAASQPIVWAITKPISPSSSMPQGLTRKEKRRWVLTQPLQAAELYREGQMVRPILPSEYQTSSQPWQSLWSTYESLAEQQTTQ